MDVPVTGIEGVSFCMCACSRGDTERLKKYIDSGGSIEVRDEWNRTPIIFASSKGREGVVRLLVDCGADLDARGYRGASAIIHATNHGYEHIVQLIADRGANIDIQDSWGKTAIMYASENGNETIVRILLDHGSNVGLVNNRKRTALHSAFTGGYHDIALLLAQKTISDREVPYSGAPVSSFIPRSKGLCWENHVELRTKIVPIYLDRAVEDPEFGLDMQQDIDEILGGKTNKNGPSLTGNDTIALTKLLKTLRSIDYTERPERENSKNIVTAYDMEL